MTKPRTFTVAPWGGDPPHMSYWVLGMSSSVGAWFHVHRPSLYRLVITLNLVSIYKSTYTLLSKQCGILVFGNTTLYK